MQILATLFSEGASTLACHGPASGLRNATFDNRTFTIDAGARMGPLRTTRDEELKRLCQVQGFLAGHPGC